MNHTLRNWLIAILAFLLLLVLAYLLAQSKEQKQVKISLPLPVQIADQLNAFTDLQALGQKLVQEMDQDSALSAKFFRNAQGNEWDAAFVAEVLRGKDSLFADMDEICELPHCQAPATSGPQDIRPDLMPHLRLLRMRCLAVQHALRQEDSYTSLGHLKASLRLATLIANDANNFHTYLVGMIMLAIVDKQIVEFLNSDPLDASQLLELQQLLKQWSPQTITLQNALWGECRYALGSRMLVVDLMEGRLTPEEAWPGADLSSFDLPDNWLVKTWLKWSYMPKVSRLLVHDSFAQLIKRCEQPVKDWEDTRHFKEPGLFSRILLPNGEGRYLAYNMPERVSPILAMKAQRVACDARFLSLAARRFLLERGRPIQKLEDLLPDYIDALPLDPFDGKPLRYLPELNSVYSVGWDCLDQGGSREDRDNLQYSETTSFQLDKQDLVYALDSKGLSLQTH